MFEMFALLINFNHLWRNDYLLLVFCLSSCVKLSYIEDYSTPSSTLHVPEFAAGICRENLPWLFAARVGGRNLPQKFAVAICGGFFVFVSTFFFVYVIKSCLYGKKPFLYVSKTFLFVRFSLLTVFLFVIAVAAMGHCT